MAALVNTRFPPDVSHRVCVHLIYGIQGPSESQTERRARCLRLQAWALGAIAWGHGARAACAVGLGPGGLGAQFKKKVCAGGHDRRPL